MLKKTLIYVLIFALALGALAITASAANPDAVDYRVGYGKMDLNPYWSVWEAAGNTIPSQAMTSDGEKVTSDHIMPLPMGGYGGNVHRLSRPELVDDNGSGKHAKDVVYLENNRYTEAFAKEMLGEGTDAYKAYAAKGFGQNDGDGIYVTCVSIQQNKNAQPILVFSVDLISVGESYCGQAKNVIIQELNKIGISITPDRILINATHTHGAVAMGESFTSTTTYNQKLWGNTSTVPFQGSELSQYLSFFRTHLYNQLAAAAVKALTEGQTNGSVTMSKGTIDVSQATGYQLNGVRHSKAQLTTTVDGVSQKVDYVTGSSFNVNLKNADGTKAKEISAVSDSDDLLHVIKFTFPKNSNVKPILMVNWRAHTTANNKMNTKAHNNLSADFVAAMRYKLELWGFRPILNYGASGNLGMGDTPSTYNVSTSSTNTTMPATKYGYELAYAAAYLADSNVTGVKTYRSNKLNEIKDKRGSYSSSATSTYQIWNKVYTALQNFTSPGMKTCTQGQILLESTYYTVLPQASSDAGYEAALYHNALAVDEGGSAANDGGLKLEKSGYPFLVKAGTYTANGQTYTVSGDVVIASQYHANSLKNRHGSVSSKRISLTAFTLGNQVAFATVPFEASDRYSMEATLETANNYNDWNDLINDSKWGTPIVMSLTNGAEGYFPNNLAYTYDTELEAKYIAGNCAQAFVSGSYEAHTAFAAAGQGEQVVAALNTLLRGLGDPETETTKLGYCEGCKTTAVWRPLTNKILEDGGNYLLAGHYYLAEDFENIFGAANTLSKTTVCLDLNGKTLFSNTASGQSRVFTVNGVLNIQDSAGGGVMKGRTDSGKEGTTLYVGSNGTANIYSGTITAETAENVKGAAGGTIYVLGKLNIYGGEITGGNATVGGNIYMTDGALCNMYGGKITYGSGGSGGNVYVLASSSNGAVKNRSVFNFYGGEISYGTGSSYGGNVQVQGGIMNMYGGKIANGKGGTGKNLLVSQNSPCPGTFRFAGGYISTNTHIMGDLILGGEASQYSTSVTNLSVANNKYTVTLDGMLSARVKISYSSSNTNYSTALGGKVGTAVSGSSINTETGYMRVGNYYAYVAENNELILASAKVALAAKQHSGDTHNLFATIEEAMSANTTADAPVVLLANVDALTLTKDTYLDLNGFHVTELNLDGHTLYCMDSVTGDYDLADKKFGTVPSLAGVKAAPGYLAGEEADNKLSFHKYDMVLTDLVINPVKMGVTYKSSFRGDAVVQAQIKEFGIAMHAYTAPQQADIESDLECRTHLALTKDAWMTGSADDAVKSVYISDILDNAITASLNQARAQVEIYGRPYMVLEDGTMLLGNAESFTMQGAMEHVDSWWNILDQQAQDALLAMYADEAYHSFMQTWNIPNIKITAEYLAG